jgi:DNA invertase Pin-like site-specific DNA recombinase
MSSKGTAIRDTDRVCIYVRPHPASGAADQERQLRAWASAKGHTVAAAFVEPERKRGADRRPEASRMLADAPNARWGRVAAVSLLALCRSVQHADAIFAQLASLGVAVSVLAEGVDTMADAGRTAAAFALAGQLDHDLHTERALTGARKRAAAGHRAGRPRVPATTEARIVALLQARVSAERITRMIGCGKSTIYRIRRELESAKGGAA